MLLLLLVDKFPPRAADGNEGLLTNADVDDVRFEGVVDDADLDDGVTGVGCVGSE